MHVGKQMDFSCCFWLGRYINFGGVSGKHCFGIGTLDSDVFECWFLIDVGAVETKEMSGGGSVEYWWGVRDWVGGT